MKDKVFLRSCVIFGLVALALMLFAIYLYDINIYNRYYVALGILVTLLSVKVSNTQKGRKPYYEREEYVDLYKKGNPEDTTLKDILKPYKMCRTWSIVNQVAAFVGTFGLLFSAGYLFTYCIFVSLTLGIYLTYDNLITKKIRNNIMISDEREFEKIKILIDVLNKNSKKSELGQEHQNIGFCFYTLVIDKFDEAAFEIIDLTGIFYGEKIFNGTDLIRLLKEYIEYIKSTHNEKIQGKKDCEISVAVEMFEEGETEISEEDLFSFKEGYKHILFTDIENYLEIFKELKV